MNKKLKESQKVLNMESMSDFLSKIYSIILVLALLIAFLPAPRYLVAP